MDDIRDTRPWFWILFFVVFAIAVVGLVISISANSSSVDEKKVVNDATAEIKEELAGLHGALKAADEFQEESNKLARLDRIRIRRAVGAAVAGGNKRLKRLSNQVAALESGQAALKTETAHLRQSVSNINAGQESLQAEADELSKEILQIRHKTGL